MIRLNVHPDEGVRFVRVNVHPTRKAMLTYCNGRPHYAKVGRDTLGVCTEYIRTSYRKGKRARRHPCFAEVNMYVGGLTFEIISHEFFHATCAFARRAKIDTSHISADSNGMQVEERLARAHGAMIARFYARMDYILEKSRTRNRQSGRGGGRPQAVKHRHK